MSIELLEASLDAQRWWLILWTAVVALGLVVEYASPIASAIRSVCRTRSFGGIKVDDSSALRTVVGGILITVGVCGEFGTEFRSARIETALRAANNSLVAQQDATINELRRRAILVAEALDDRRLPAERQRAVATALKGFAGRIVYIRSNFGDGEAKTLALEMKGAMELAGIRVEDRTGQPLGGEALLGIHVECAPREREFSESLIRTFADQGKLPMLPLPPYGCGLGVTDISVGQKGPPQLKAIQK